MRLIVGPLPAAVYWRRRAIVLGVLLLALLMVTYACATAGGSGADPQDAQSPPAGTTASPQRNDAATPAPTGVIAPADAASPSPPAASAAPTDGSMCRDDETTVTAKTARTALTVGSEVIFTLLVKNTSDRTCTVDVGPDLQELRLVRGTEKVWSSDDCGGPTGSQPRVFPSGQENSYAVLWNGKSSSACAKSKERTPEGPVPTAGEYTLIARVGTDQSTPVTITIS
jgi:hypothetical protein